MKPILKYAILFLALLAIEILIALYVHDSFVRPFVGDTLAVLLIYYFLMFWATLFKVKVSKRWVAFGVLLFAIGIEIGQAFNLVEMLGLQDYKIARIVIGTSFAWEDLVAYTVGFLFILVSDP